MKSYITKPLSTRYSIIKQKRYSLGAFSYRKVDSKNQNIQTLENLIIDKKKWFEPWSDAYIPFSDSYFVRISEMEDLSFTFTITNQTNRIVPPEKSRQIIKKWDICYQTASNVGNVCLYDWPDAYYNSHIIRLNTEKRWYVFAFLKSAFCRNQVEVWWSIKWVDNFTEDFLLDTRIPFPTIKNHPHPEKVEEYVSLLVQNMIDKEEQIRRRNDQIDELIERELRENQKQKIFTYRLPRLSELKKEGRLDAWYYGEKYKKEDAYFESYSWWYSDIFSLGYEISRWQNLQVSNIGESWYFDGYKKWSYRLLLSKYFANRIIERFSYIWNKCELKTIKKWDIIFSCRWEMWRAYYFPEEIENTITNIDNVHIIATSRSIEERAYLFCMLWFLKKQWILDSIACTGSWAPSFTKYQFEKLKIPNFPESKQQEIAKLYYNPIPENTDLILENYLEREKIRNSEVGIFQLNMEIFALREKLEEIVDAIVMEREIHLPL